MIYQPLRLYCVTGVTKGVYRIKCIGTREAPFHTKFHKIQNIF